MKYIYMIYICMKNNCFYFNGTTLVPSGTICMRQLCYLDFGK